jgi:hypothetical protein
VRAGPGPGAWRPWKRSSVDCRAVLPYDCEMRLPLSCGCDIFNDWLTIHVLLLARYCQFVTPALISSSSSFFIVPPRM